MIKYEGRNYSLDQNETVLDCLLRHGIAPPYSCKSGLCHTCLMRATQGTPTSDSQKGLKQSQISQNYFLGCACVPNEFMDITLPNSEAFRSITTVLNIAQLNDSVLRLRLKKPDNFNYFAGQYVTIYNNNGIGRSYSLASVPGTDDFLEFHIQVIPNGTVSNWIKQAVSVDDSITIGEAIGSGIYTNDNLKQSIALIGTGTGLAPLYGILRTALLKQHKGDIRLYHGSRSSANLYLQDALQQLANEHSAFTYIPCISGAEPLPEALTAGRANDVALKDIVNFKKWRVYLCGNADMVKASKRSIFLAGASMQDISADPFAHA
ncbi:MAG: 2Fe-2S iron-sulfur cluster binding domain-containing protein [Gammaproteobacteria bacterium]|nr:2Fe-2S iron-sulfur cluster binding domain-containing protein [Gammaproteobacteria bacterium]